MIIVAPTVPNYQISSDIQDIFERACQVTQALVYRPLFKVLFFP